MDDLSSLLLAAIEEKEQLAQACLYASHAGTWTADSDTVWIRIPADDRWSDGLNHEDDVEIATTDDTMHRPFHFEWAKHIAHNDPSSVLRRCAADRRVLERHSPVTDSSGRLSCSYCEDAGHPEWPCGDFEDLMDRYGLSDHQEGEA